MRVVDASDDVREGSLIGRARREEVEIQVTAHVEGDVKTARRDVTVSERPSRAHTIVRGKIQAAELPA